MNTENEQPIDRLINSVGVATFVNYFVQFSDLYQERITKNEIAKLFRNLENWTESSITTKINVGLRIFTLNLELEAIEHILKERRTGNIPNGDEIMRKAEIIRNTLTGSGWNLKPGEISENEYLEGTTRAVLVNTYDRNQIARDRCIEHFGLNCQVCGFNFKEKYGEIGKDFIHVHHKVDISTIGKKYSVNPIEDLIPVCPNCHYMLHKKRPAYTIEELKNIMNL